MTRIVRDRFTLDAGGRIGDDDVGFRHDGPALVCDRAYH